MHAYLLFHSLAEIVAATISLATFVFAWNTRRHQNAYLLTLGMAAAFIGAFEALHCLAFPGMSVFPGYDANLSPQLWLSARLFQAGAGLAGLLLLPRRVRDTWLLAGFGIAFSALSLAIFAGAAPLTVRASGGLTSFKVAMEWSLAACFLVSAALLLRYRDLFSRPVFRTLVASSVTMAACEVCFTLYVSPYGLANLLGHLLLLAGGGLQFAAIVRVGLLDPGETYLRDLTQAEERLRLFVDHAPAALAMFDRRLRYVSASRRWMVDYGLGDADLRGRSHYEVFPEIGEEWKAVHRRALGGEVVRAEADPFARADGTIQWLRWEVRPWHEPDGAIGGIVVFSEDITEKKLAEDALRRYELVVQQSRDAILFMRREDGRILEANQAASTAYGYTRDELLTLSIHDLRADDTRDAAPGQMHEADEAGVLFETEHRRKDGSTFPVEVSSRGATVAGIRTLVSVIRDITDRRRTEQREHEQRREAERRAAELDAVDHQKNEFLALLSHELRNPLAAIAAGLHVLERVGPGAEAANRAQAVIRRQTNQLTRLVDDLLDVTRLSRNKIRLQLETVAVNDLVGRVVEDHRVLFDTAGILLGMEPAPTAPLIEADPSRVAQIVGNLLQNAVKFTPSGGQVSVRVAAPPAGKSVAIEVHDSGAGLSGEVLGRMFQPFVQADATLDRSKGGLGLGLWLVKGLTELHGGEVSAHSDGLGRGARFVVRLPSRHCAEVSPRRAEPERPPRCVRVLVIEDNADAAESLRDALALEGDEVTVAHGGAEGLALARTFRPDVVLCDLGLPGMDGYSVARAFRGDPVLSATRLVALSGYAAAADRERARQAGFDRHLAKPADIPTVQRVLIDLTNS